MRRAVTAAICAVLVFLSLPAAADDVYPIVFPVAGDNYFSDTYDAPRGGGRIHQATDIMAAKMTPVVAAADGTVGWVGTSCCFLELEHDDGYQSWYIHLNNDTPGTDDGLGQGIAPGIESGVHVEAGQLLGWVGDSGNAEQTASHLHFQLHYPDGTRFNPYESLLAAERVDPAAADEMFFYRDDGLFGYYEMNTDGTLGSTLASGNGYTTDWSTITSVNLDGDDDDEIFFYRDDGLFRFYDIRSDGTLPTAMLEGDGYTTDWTSVAAVDLDGDGQDELFFYRQDGLFRYYNINSDGSLSSPMSQGENYLISPQTESSTSVTPIQVVTLS